MRVAFSDLETDNDFTATLDNFAGAVELQGGNLLLGAVRTKGNILLFSDTTVFSMTFVGQPDVYAFQTLSENTGLVGPNAVVEHNGTAYWMGDDGFLWKESDQTRKFNFHGDTQWIKARVSGKRREATLHIVDLEVWCENQRGEVTSPGTASVLLPSRNMGPVTLPVPGTSPTPLKTTFAVETPGCTW